jgi:photosystem II stability/assembly factor-like uncharacterized protein
MKGKLTFSLLGIVALCLGAAGASAQVGWTSTVLTSSGRDLNAVYFVDSKRGWVGGDAGFLSYTDDGGATWLERRIDTKRHGVNDIYFVSPETGFVVAGDTIFSTNDSGHNWQAAHTFAASDFQGATPELYSLRFNGKKRGWVVGSISRGDNVVGSILAITRDGGATWQSQDTNTNQELIHIDFVDDKRGWIVGAAGAILHTDNAGESWVRQNSNTTVTLFHVDFRNEKQGLAVGEQGMILLTGNGGASWSPVDSRTRSTLLSVQFVSEDESWIVGRNGVILRSGDGGLTWAEQESGTKKPLYAMFMNKKNGWAVGSDGLLLTYRR